MSETLIRPLEERAALLHSQRGQLLDAAQREQRGLLASEQRGFDASQAESMQIKIRVDELREQDAREARAAACRVESGSVGLQSAYTSSETYHRGPDSPSFFADLYAAQCRGDWDASQRLQRNNAERGVQTRALGNTGGVGGSGGELAPPAWLLQDFVALARPGRVTADRVHREDLPAGVSSINIPKASTGTTVAVQSTQNSLLSQSDMATSALSSPITTIAGKQVVSVQLMQQSGVPIDKILLNDLAADYGKQLDTQVLSGAGTGGQFTGILNVPGINQIVYTQATPTVVGVGGYYATVNKAISAISTARFLPPDVIVMHPRRWSWLAASFDGQNRPLVSPSGNAFNQIAEAGTVAAQGPVGQVAGLPVYLDPNLPTNLGVGTNQDPTLIMRSEDLYLWESPIFAEAFDAPYADSLGILLRLHAFSSFQGARYPASIAVVNGSGSVPPAY